MQTALSRDRWALCEDGVDWKSVSGSLVDSFLGSVAEPLQPQFSAMTDLPVRLRTMCEEGEQAWPGLTLERTVFVAFIGSRITDSGADDGDAVNPDKSLSALRASDLYLTCACAEGDRQALAFFDQRYISQLNLALARMRPRPEQVDEIKQLVRQKLFVSETKKTGKIVAYSGRGDLRRWVRSIAIRTFLNQIRKYKREVQRDPDQPIFDDVSDDPEIEYMKRRYRKEFRAAFVQALRQLDDRQQNLLRYHHVDGLNIDEIGAIYRVHRVTAYRWLEKARDALVKKTQTLLSAQLKVEKREFDSIMRLIRSQLHLSLVRHLGEDVDRAPTSDDDSDTERDS